MEGRSRNILVVLIALVIAVAVFSSFGMDFFTPVQPPITLPPEAAGAVPESMSPEEGAKDMIRVSVTPETVQSVIATLARPGSYYRQVTVEYPERGGRLTSEQWVDGGWSKSDTVLPGGMVRHSIVREDTLYYWYGNSRSWVSAPADERSADLEGPHKSDTVLPGGMVRHSIVREDTLYYWYGNSRSWVSAPADERSADLEGPHIPTYEDVLEEERSAIVEAGYVEKDGMACIYVAVEHPELDSVSRYWVAVENGLLTAAEQCKGDTLVLSMTAAAAERPVAAGTVFALPDGTRLHTVAET